MVDSFLDHYKLAGFSRNAFYILERLVSVIYTWEDFSKNCCELINQLEIDLEYIDLEDLTDVKLTKDGKKVYKVKKFIQYILTKITLLGKEMTFILSSQPSRARMDAVFAIDKQEDYYRDILNAKYYYKVQGGKFITMNEETEKQKMFALGTGEDILRSMMANYKRTRTLLNAFKSRKGDRTKIAGFRKEAGVLGKDRVAGSGIQRRIVESLRQKILNERFEREREMAEIKLKKKLENE